LARRTGRKPSLRVAGVRHVSPVSAVAVTPEDAFKELSKFCRDIGGEPYPENAGLASAIGGFECRVARGLSNKEITTLITSEIPRRLHLLKALNDSPLTEFTIKMDDGKTVKYRLGGSVSVSVFTTKDLDVDPARISYAYPDHIEDGYRDETAEILVTAKGYTSKTTGRPYAVISGRLIFNINHPSDPKLVEEKLKEFDEIINDIVKNPRNLFKMKE